MGNRGILFAFAVTLLFSVIARHAFASFDTRKGARPLGMGGAFVAQADNGDAYYYNPAGLWQITRWHAQAFYSAPYNLTQLGTASFTLTAPTRWGNGTLNAESYGYDLYRETSLGMAYSRSWRRRCFVGVAVNVYHLFIKGGGSTAAAGVDAGFLFKPVPQLALGIYARNLNQPRIAGEALPQVLAMGLSARPVESLSLNLDVVKDVLFAPDFRFGMEYTVTGRLLFRLGVSSEPSRFSAGIGLDFGPGVVDYALYTHRDLGVTHAVSVSVRLSKTHPIR